MLIYSFLDFLTLFPKNFIINNAYDGRNIPSCPFLAFVTSFTDTVIIIEEATGCIIEEDKIAINESAMGGIIAPRNLPFYFFI